AGNIVARWIENGELFSARLDIGTRTWSILTSKRSGVRQGGARIDCAVQGGTYTGSFSGSVYSSGSGGAFRQGGASIYFQTFNGEIQEFNEPVEIFEGNPNMSTSHISMAGAFSNNFIIGLP